MKAFLPGTIEQVNNLLEKLDVSNMPVCIFGSNSEYQAFTLSNESGTVVNLIVEDHDSFINSKLALKGDKNIDIKVMAFDSTDFKDSSFDLVYAQASISSQDRTRIIKEIKRILKPEGYFCVGEIVSLVKEPPVFVKDIWFRSGIVPLQSNEIKHYYEERNFKVIYEVDLSSTLKDFYSMGSRQLNQMKEALTEEEKSYYKKLLNQVSHESNAYLKLGGNKYIGFKSLLLQKI